MARGLLRTLTPLIGDFPVYPSGNKVESELSARAASEAVLASQMELTGFEFENEFPGRSGGLEERGFEGRLMLGVTLGFAQSIPVVQIRFDPIHPILLRHPSPFSSAKRPSSWPELLPPYREVVRES